MNDPKQPVQLFDESAGAMALAQSDAAAVARATQEIQAALVIAQRCPRDEVKVKAKILQACKRRELAEVSEYQYSRGGTKITGPTIDLLRAVANRWGNLRYGWEEKDRSGGISSVRCFAWDMQTNSQAERTFKVKHWRDTREGGYELKDERDIYEMLANSAARRVRACLEEVIDSDIINAAVDECRLTMKNGETTPLADRAVAMVSAFQEFGVTATMIEVKLGNNLAAVSENQLAQLRRIYKSLKDGVGNREDFFKPETSAPQFDEPAKSAGTAAAATERLKGETKGPISGTEPPLPATKAPEPATEPPQVEKSAYNPLKALRALLKMGSHKEAELLDFLATTGATDGSQSSLEDVMLTMPQVIQSTAENFAPISAKLKELKGGGK